jgi:hypothetical protein
LEVEGAMPCSNEQSFANWWAKTIRKVKEIRIGVNSSIILTSWLIWRCRNACVFDGIAPSVDKVLRHFREEYQLWGLAGPKKLQDLKLHGIGASN